MDSPRIDAVARLMASGIRRQQLTRSLAGALLGGLALPGAALAGCKKAGKKCDKNKDCCDGAECKGGECKCKSGRDECGGKCYKLNNDEKHCGDCDTKCEAGETCRDGVCEGGGPCGGETCAATEECDEGVCTPPTGGCPAGANSCAPGGFTPCASGTPCVCLQTTEGTTRCGDQSTPGAVCGQCWHSDDCAWMGEGAFCANTCCPDIDNSCRLPCPG